MLNKSLMIKLLMFAMILVGCASNNVAENEVNDINENPKVQDGKVEDNNLSTITENNEVTEYIEQPQPQTESKTIFYDPQPVDNTPSSEPVVEQPQPQVPACDDTIPYGGYTSWGEVNAAAQAELNERMFTEGWFSGKYDVYTFQTECGTIYYTYAVTEFK